MPRCLQAKGTCHSEELKSGTQNVSNNPGSKESQCPVPTRHRIITEEQAAARYFLESLLVCVKWFKVQILRVMNWYPLSGERITV